MWVASLQQLRYFNYDAKIENMDYGSGVGQYVSNSKFLSIQISSLFQLAG